MVLVQLQLFSSNSSLPVTSPSPFFTQPYVFAPKLFYFGLSQTSVLISILILFFWVISSKDLNDSFKCSFWILQQSWKKKSFLATSKLPNSLLPPWQIHCNLFFSFLVVILQFQSHCRLLINKMIWIKFFCEIYETLSKSR